MTEDKGILIKNIFYMLSYAYQVLRQSNYKKIESEPFDNVCDLFAAILVQGMNQQIKQGLHKEYISYTDDLFTVKGKLNMQGTIQNKLKRMQRINCDFDELSENNRLNQILKTSAIYLLRQPEVKKENKQKLRDSLQGFVNVDEIARDTIRWNTLTYHRNNQSYRMLMFICYFVLNDLLLTTSVGKYKMRMFTDEHMAALYEKFILEYYKKTHSELHPKPLSMGFDIRQEVTAEALSFLPRMKTDITLTKGDRTLIIDAKYYKNIWQTYDDRDPETSESIRSGHIYQIMTYVHNNEALYSGKVGGMLLYAQTGDRHFELNYPDISGNPYYIRTFDLNQDFSGLRNQLESIVKLYFN